MLVIKRGYETENFSNIHGKIDTVSVTMILEEFHELIIDYKSLIINKHNSYLLHNPLVIFKLDSS